MFEHIPTKGRRSAHGPGTCSPPGEAVDLLTGQIGEPTHTQLLSDRRGSRAWKIQGPRGAIAVKANNPDRDDARDKAAEMAQEDDLLLRLTAADTHIPAQPAADNWSLGVPLFWCWTGHRPVAYDDTIDRLEKPATIVKGTTTALRGIRP
ncbi:hypothetical protein [Streptomyces platensis]|uniref:hypothetical protein n=1 Tax=Streptomyces platensis TaxID=58346 RepID=UPI00331BCA31